MKTLHINHIDQSRRVYCYRNDALVTLSANFFQNNCFKCPYLVDDLNGTGVECEYDDASTDEQVVFWDASEAEKYAKMAAVRLKIDTEENVIARLKGYNADDGIEESDVVESEDEEKGHAENLKVLPESEEIQSELT